MKNKKRILFTLCLTLLFTILPVQAAVPYDTYSYDWWKEDVLQPHAYLYSKSLTDVDMGTSLNNAQDLFIYEDKLYVADTGNSRILKLSTEGEVELELSSFRHGSKKEQLLNPQGVFVTGEGHIYVADSGNGRIVEFDEKGEYIREIGRPETDLISSSQNYIPTKVVVDDANRIYVIAYGINLGLVEFNEAGEFQGFMGATEVSVGAFEYMWKNYFSTQAQKERMQSIIPTEYSNIFVDQENFVYATISNLSDDDYANSADAIRRLNPTGTDVLRRLGNYPIIGDLYSSSETASWSVFTDVYATNYGCYFILDSTGGKVHVYDYDGNSLFIFGSKGGRDGNVQKASSIGLSEDERKVYILDAQLNSILVFDITDYGSHLLGALKKHRDGDAQGAYTEWLEVLRYNTNSEPAYIGIGKTFLKEGNYERAMEYFKLGNSRKYYTKAFKFYRKEKMQAQFPIYMSIIGVIVLAIIIWRLIKKIKKWVGEAKCNIYIR